MQKGTKNLPVSEARRSKMNAETTMKSCPPNAPQAADSTPDGSLFRPRSQHDSSATAIILREFRASLHSASAVTFAALQEAVWVGLGLAAGGTVGNHLGGVVGTAVGIAAGVVIGSLVSAGIRSRPQATS